MDPAIVDEAEASEILASVYPSVLAWPRVRRVVEDRLGAETDIEVHDDARRAALSADVVAFRRAAGEQGLVLGTRRAMSVVYAPFEHINEAAAIVIVGLTPGRFQAANALDELQRSSRDGASWGEALAAAKVHASFGGPMRRNLVAMLNAVGVAGLLGIPDCADLFGSSAHLAHFTSALRYPVFVGGANYGGTPSIVRTPWLLRMAEQWLARELGALPSAYVVPLGPKVCEVIAHLAREGVVNEDRVLGGLPHPSGANAERIAYFLGRKAAGALSTRTDAVRIDASRQTLERQVAQLRMGQASVAPPLARAS